MGDCVCIYTQAYGEVCWDQRQYKVRENILVIRVLENNMGSSSVPNVWKLLHSNATLQWRSSGQRDLWMDIYSQKRNKKLPAAFLFYWVLFCCWGFFKMDCCKFLVVSAELCKTCSGSPELQENPQKINGSDHIQWRLLMSVPGRKI